MICGLGGGSIVETGRQDDHLWLCGGLWGNLLSFSLAVIIIWWIVLLHAEPFQDDKFRLDYIPHTPAQYLCIRQRKPWTPPPQGSTQIRRRDDVESWGVYFQGLVNLDLINFLTMWIFTLCKFRPGESWPNAVYISSENVLNTKIDCSKNVLLIVVLVEYKLKWMCC